MIEVKVSKWRAADGELYDTKEQAAAVDQRVWEGYVFNVLKSGANLVCPYDRNVMNLLDFLLSETSTHRQIVYCTDNTVYDEQFRTVYIWCAHTEEQTDLIATTIKKHGLISSESVDELIVKGVFDKYLDRTMVLQVSMSAKDYASSRDYRVVDGLDKAMLELCDTQAYIKKMLYKNQSNEEGDSEK